MPSSLTIIEQYLSGISQLPKSIKAGNNLNSEEVLMLSGTYKSLNLMKETALLSCIIDGMPNFLLTDFFLYILDEKTNLVEVETKKFENLKYSFLGDQEKQILTKCIELIAVKQVNNRKTLDGFLDKYKKLVSEEKENYQNNELFFDGQYIDLLHHESSELIKLCDELNSDPHFIQSLNLIFSSTDEAIDGYRAEHVLISDLIKAYNQVALNENEKGKFTLAYFFESLKGKDLAKGISIERLNQMTTNASFNKNIEKIKQAEFIQVGSEYKDEYLMPSILFRMNHPLFMKSGNIIYRLASIITKADGVVNEEEKKALKNILERTTQPKHNSSGINANTIPEGDSMDAVMAELDLLIGLEEVKKSVKELANLLKVQKLRKEKGISNIEIGLHAVFMGPPGTGKTTIARLMGRLYKHLAYLEKGQLVETDRAGMVAGYVGQTAIKVNDIIKESLGGVLFIDEAYSLTPADGGHDFGYEAVDTLIKRMEDYRNQLVVIVAGYTEPMKLFVESNPGLRSRFNRFFKFDHFLPTQLLQIFIAFCTKSDFNITEDAKDKLLDTFEMLYEKRDEGFGNARVVRNLFERCVQTQANRIVSLPEITKEILQTIEEQDVPEPKSTLEQVYSTVL